MSTDAYLRSEANTQTAFAVIAGVAALVVAVLVLVFYFLRCVHAAAAAL